jgi:hypothetical protein
MQVKRNPRRLRQVKNVRITTNAFYFKYALTFAKHKNNVM